MIEAYHVSKTYARGVYALRVAAALFGHNAPQSIAITQTPDGHGGSTSKVTTSELPLDEEADVVRLDNGQYATVTQRENPGVRNGDYVEVRGDHVYAR